MLYEVVAGTAFTKFSTRQYRALFFYEVDRDQLAVTAREDARLIHPPKLIVETDR